VDDRRCGDPHQRSVGGDGARVSRAEPSGDELLRAGVGRTSIHFERASIRFVERIGTGRVPAGTVAGADRRRAGTCHRARTGRLRRLVMLLAAAAGPSPFWFITRATGAVSLVLLTLSVTLGIVNVRRAQIAGVPRFVLDSVHRTASLLAVAFVFVHIVTTLLDGYAPVSLLDVVIPFGSAYRPVWLGLGAVAFDLLIAITITSLLRRRLGHGPWRATHWLAYASWPVALVHGLGTGSDAKTHWLLVLSGVCVVAVLAGVLERIRAGWPDHLATRVSALGAVAVLALGLLVWLPAGPLGGGWAARAGTPASLLGRARTSAASTATGNAPVTASSASASSRSRTGAGHASAVSAFTKPADGRVRQVTLANGLVLVDLSLTVHGTQSSVLHIRIKGESINGGGVQMSTSRVTLGPPTNPDQYDGQVTGLAGTTIAAHVSDARNSTLSLVAHLQISPGPGTASGTVTATPEVTQ
jgi:sulfoxide reductase heme-binding subunit YedZ